MATPGNNRWGTTWTELYASRRFRIIMAATVLGYLLLTLVAAPVFGMTRWLGQAIRGSHR